MDPIFILLLVALLLISYVIFKPKWVQYKRNKIIAQPFPKAWREILRKNVPYFYRMPADLQLQLKNHIQIFLREKSFYGFESIEINDEIKVTIAAQACLLLLNRKTNYYPKLRSIYVYPAAFVTRHEGRDAAGVLQNNQRVLSGESWELGKVVLSWRDTQSGSQDYTDGQNVVIHEFAHQLDQETGAANGAPFLKQKGNRCWSTVLSKEFDLLRTQIAAGKSTLLDSYGATNPAEFFAVASEVFFEKAADLKQQHFALYEQLKNFYQVDPAIWQ